MSRRLGTVFNRARIDDRQINELIGLAKGIVADKAVNQAEAEALYAWLVANRECAHNPMIISLYERVRDMLSDNFLDREEQAELMETLTRFSGADIELGEITKSTSLPLDEPAPIINFPGKRFCFTGTFAFGSRRDCKKAVEERGGLYGNLTMSTDYLVLGSYATDSWAHSAFGRKIEKAIQYRDDGRFIKIVSEHHWLGAIEA